MKVVKGTPIHGESKCLTCRYATITKGFAESQYRVYCHELGARVGWPVSECTGFSLKGELNLSQLEAMAYILEEKSGKYGFRPLKDTERTY
jgi:hypothetical protein